MTRIASFALGLLLAVPVVLPAQPGPPDGDRPGRAPAFEELKDYLGLSDQQITDLRAVQSASREAIRPIFEQIAAKRRVLRDAMRQEPRDELLVGQLMSDLEDLRAQPAAKRAEFRDDALNILTAEQRTALAALEQALTLLPAAGQAARFNLIEGPEQGFAGHHRGRRGRGDRPLRRGGGPAGSEAL